MDSSTRITNNITTNNLSNLAYLEQSIVAPIFQGETITILRNSILVELVWLTRTGISFIKGNINGGVKESKNNRISI